MPARARGQAAQRVTVQFATGRRTLLVPPARLIEPPPEPRRDSGWLEQAGEDRLDNRLRRLPEGVAGHLGTPGERAAVAAALYRYDETPASVLRWARDQVGAADPLSHWSRDELLAAFRAFCDARDSFVRVELAKLKRRAGPAAIESLLAQLEPALGERLRAALARPV